MKYGVGDGVAPGIAAGTSTGLRHDPMPTTRGAARAMQAGKGTGPGIGVHGYVAGREGGKIDRGLVQPLGGIDPEKGQGRHLKAKPQQSSKMASSP